MTEADTLERIRRVIETTSTLIGVAERLDRLVRDEETVRALSCLRRAKAHFEVAEVKLEGKNGR